MRTATTVVGIDIGGTNVRAAAFDSAGNLLIHCQTLIEAAQGPQAGLARIKTLIGDTLREIQGYKLVGIGVGSTGPLNRARGVIQNPYTLPGWEEVAIVPALSGYFDVPVVLENDADAAALGEYWQGAGQGVSRLLALTIGTGVGTSLVIDGEVYRGWQGLHPEGGHHIVDPAGPLCYCGARGCLEILVSGPAIARQAQEKVIDGLATDLRDRVDGDLSQIDARIVSEAARSGDSIARAVLDRVAGYVAIGLLNMISLFVPEVIVLGGSVMNNYDLFEPTIRSFLDQRSVLMPASSVRIVSAKLGDRAGVFGAAYALWQSLK